jgi:hypothetical protein
MLRPDAASHDVTNRKGPAIPMQPTVRSARRLLDPRVIALRLVAAVVRRPRILRQVKALAAWFPMLERRLKARIFSLPDASEWMGAGQALPAEPVSGQARWLHARLEARRAARR